MREVLYRGKRLDNGEWIVSGSLRQWENGSVGLMTEYGMFKVDPLSVGEYTGKNDKNNKRIFENDIVSGLFLHGDAILAKVVFKEGAFGLEWKWGDILKFEAFTSICNVEYEVVGNISDTPELLEVKE